MLLYLVQHADAVSKEEDPARSLSDKGIQDIVKVAKHVASLDVKVSQIFHSNKIRAFQTALVLAENLQRETGIIEVDGLAPMDDPQIWFERISQINGDIMLVGHLPHLSKLASLILTGDKDKNVIDFKMGSVVCLKKSEDGKWSFEWMITPEEIK